MLFLVETTRTYLCAVDASSKSEAECIADRNVNEVEICDEWTSAEVLTEARARGLEIFDEYPYRDGKRTDSEKQIWEILEDLKNAPPTAEELEAAGQQRLIP